jgi:hypothetical protein
MADKVTVMVIKVDLQCSTCYRKIKKLLCKSPEVRDQLFDEKQNQVTISVVSCCPDRIRAKLKSKAGKVIKSIETAKPKTKEPEKPKSDDKPKAEAAKPKSDDKLKPKSDDKPKGADTAKPKSDDKPKAAAADTAKPKSDDKPKGDAAAKPKSDDKPKDAEKPKSVEKAHAMIFDPHGYSVPGIVGHDPYIQYGYPVANAGWGYGEPSYEGYVGAPYYNGYVYGSRPVPPQTPYNYGARPVPPQTPYDYGRGYSYGEDNSSTCTIM